MSKFTESEEFKKGHSFEISLSGILKENGTFVLPCYENTGEKQDKAPKMYGEYKGLVLPDLFICNNGRSSWIECKVKASPTVCTKKGYPKGRLEHGIPLRLYNDYMEVQKVSGLKVWLFLLEESSGEILYNTLDALSIQEGPDRIKIYENNKMSYGGMIFFSRRIFKIYRKL